MSHNLPDDWYEDHDGQGLVLDAEKVAAEIARLRALVQEALGIVPDGGSQSIDWVMRAQAALSRIPDLRDAEIERLRKGIQDYLDGNYVPKMLSRANKLPCGHFACGACEGCVSEYFTKLMAGDGVRPNEQSERGDNHG